MSMDKMNVLGLDVPASSNGVKEKSRKSGGSEEVCSIVSN